MEFDFVAGAPQGGSGISELFCRAIDMRASDIFVVPGSPVMLKCEGTLMALTQGRVSSIGARALVEEVYRLAGDRPIRRLEESGDDDFSFSVRQIGRFRCSAYRQRGSYAAVLRVVPFGLPDAEAFNIPQEVLSLADARRGLVLVTGNAGSGKSTTLACLIDRINRSREGHIITIEDPIEFLYPHQRSVVSQREVTQDTESFGHALRAALRQAPDVILLGEMRDYETIHTALTAAETGHLLFSTLHTVGAAKTIDRLIDVFPAQQQQQVRVQLSMVLHAVVSQQLIPARDGGLVPAFEVMIVTRAIQNMIREGKVHQIDNAIFSGSVDGMRTMDADLLRLHAQGRISRADALAHAVQPDTLERRL